MKRRRTIKEQDRIDYWIQMVPPLILLASVAALIIAKWIFGL